MKRHFWNQVCIRAAVVFLSILTVYGPGLSSEGAVAGQKLISGTVADDNGPVAGATVRLQGAIQSVSTDGAGVFQLTAPPGKVVNIGAWKQGYYCSLLRNITAPAQALNLQLRRYQTGDNDGYEWIPPDNPSRTGACSQCHNPAIIQMALKDAHLKAATNPRFLTMFNGTDTEGNQSPPTRYDYGKWSWKYIVIPYPPDPSLPYFGPGYLLDFPGTTGTCTACHIPGASIAANVDPNTVTGADQYGIHCDFCHKVGDVRLDPVSGMPFPSLPGVRSLDMRRPFTDDPERYQLFFGTFTDDNVPEEDTNLPLLKQSRYCASCHFGVFWSTVVYNSFGEWLHSPYSKAKSGKGKTCQQCHMPSPTVWEGVKLRNVAPGRGGIDRQPSAIHSHLMTVDETLLRNAVTLSSSAMRQEGKVVVNVTLTNDKTGHHVPTDSPLRHVILLIEARDADGKALEQAAGPVLPSWCGVGDPGKGYYAGLPGKTYAKLLRERWTGVFPTGAYWNETILVSDNRLAAFASDTSSFAFVPPATGDGKVTVTLLYRRAFMQLMEWKKWDVPDIVMAREELVVGK
jgi:hypothetical protein